MQVNSFFGTLGKISLGNEILEEVQVNQRCVLWIPSVCTRTRHNQVARVRQPQICQRITRTAHVMLKRFQRIIAFLGFVPQHLEELVNGNVAIAMNHQISHEHPNATTTTSNINGFIFRSVLFRILRVQRKSTQRAHKKGILSGVVVLARFSSRRLCHDSSPLLESVRSVECSI